MKTYVRPEAKVWHVGLQDDISGGMPIVTSGGISYDGPGGSFGDDDEIAVKDDGFDIWED